MKNMQAFWKHEDGAVSVDWIVITAAIVGLAVMGATAAQDGINALGTKVSDEVADTDV